MSYTITFTNGKTLAVIADQSVDNVSTSLTLIGKNVNNYGAYINNNLVGLLENFANLKEPKNPIIGQAWFDTSEGRLKVYSTGTFKPVGSPTISPATPASPVKGDLWVDTTNNILKWYDGTVWQLTSKAYSDATGTEGWVIEPVVATVVGSVSIPGSGYTYDANVSVLYSQDTPILVAANEEIPFNPTVGFATFTATITSLNPGVTLNPNVPGIRFHGTATSADSVAGLYPENFLTTSGYNVAFGRHDILNNEGFFVGTNTDIRLFVTTGTVTSVLESTIESQPFQIRYNNTSTGTLAVAMHVDSVNNRIGLLTDSPAADLDVNGSTIIRGSLTVLGTQTSLEVSVIKVEDINIELNSNSTTTATNATANGGGIILHGDNDHTFLYYNTGSSWRSSLSIDLQNNDSSYKIAGVPVLEKVPFQPGKFQLGSNVIGGPGFVNFGTLSRFTVSNVVLYSNTITTYDAIGTKDLIIEPTSGFISLNNTTQIKNMKPTEDTDPATNAVTKGYMENYVNLAAGVAGSGGGVIGRKPYTLALDITDFGNVDQEIVAYLDLTLPVDGFGNPYYAQPDGSRCTVLCTRYEATTATYFLTNLNTSTEYATINYLPAVGATATNTATFVTDFALAGSVTIETPMPAIYRTVKLFQVVGGYWTYIEDIDTNYLTSNSPHTITTGLKTFTVNKESTYFSTSSVVTIRETDTQTNSLTGPVVWFTGTTMIVSVTTATDQLNTGTFNSWIIRLA